MYFHFPSYLSFINSVISQYLHVGIILHIRIFLRKSMGLFAHEEFAGLMFKEIKEHLSFQIYMFVCPYMYIFV